MTAMMTLLTDIQPLKVEKTDNNNKTTKTILRDDEYSLRYSSSKNFERQRFDLIWRLQDHDYSQPIIYTLGLRNI